VVPENGGCAAHSGITVRVDTLEKRVDGHDARLDAGEARFDELAEARTANKSQIEALCAQMNRANDNFNELMARIDSGVKWFVGSCISLLAIVVTVVLYVVESLR